METAQTSTHDPAVDNQLSRLRRLITAAAVLVGFLVLPMLMSGTTVALPHIGTDLSATGGALQWVIVGYFLAASASMLTAGSLSDTLGRRRIFQGGAVIFIVGTMTAALAQQIWLMNAARILSGFGAAAVMAAGSAIMAVTFTGAARTRAYAAVGSTAGIGLALGPSLAGWLVDFLGWRAMFLAFTAAGVLLLVGTVFIAESRAEDSSPIDWPGAVTFMLGLGALMIAITQGSQSGWGSPQIIGLFVIGGGLLAGFWVLQRRSTHPLLDLKLLGNPSFSGWCLASLTVAVGSTGILVSLPTYLQGANGVSAGKAGLFMLMFTVPILLVPPIAGRLVNAGVSPRLLIVIALLAIAAGNALLTVLHPAISALMLAGPLILVGAGNGLAIGIIDAQAMNLVHPSRIGMASGLLNTIRGGSNAVVIAVFGTVLFTLLSHDVGAAAAEQLTAGLPPGADHPLWATYFTDAWHVVLWSVAGICAAAAAAVHLLLRTPTKEPTGSTTRPDPKH
ncbi:arabinose ABC transporter permease [Rhodococcus sp. SRB_17]|nr:arabinose ABC transporter permease [Rhodococcus sp. SRB_17]